MKVTVCELNDDQELFTNDWERLVSHVKTEESDLVLLPELPFSSWFGVTSVFQEDVWQSAVAAHDAWLKRIVELSPAAVMGTRPVNRDGKRLNEGFCWEQNVGYRIVHDKYYLPDEAGFWEATWYSRGSRNFTPTECRGAIIGFEICTELWALDQARIYGKKGVHLIVTPRATPHASTEKWLAGGQATAITSGAFSISSNHVSRETDAIHFGGCGWIISPDGDILEKTSREQPFVTVEIDLSLAERAKRTYPRYLL